MVDRFGPQTRRFRAVPSLVVALLLIGAISYLGAHTYHSSHAAAGPSIYLSPNGISLASGSTLSVTVRENSGSSNINSVQASLTYDSNVLKYVSLNEGGAFPVVAATSTSTPGVIRVGRANSDTPVSGDNAVVTVNFKIIGGAGSGSIAVDKAYSFLVTSAGNQDILQAVGSGSYAVTGNSPTPSPTPGTSGLSSSGTDASTSPTASPSTSNGQPILYVDPASGTFAAGATISATVRLNSYAISTTTVEAVVGYPVDKLQYIGASEGTTYITQQRTNNTSGSVDVIRGVSGGNHGSTGDNAVVTLKFKTLSASGSAAVTIGTNSVAYDNSGTGNSVLDISDSRGAVYALSSSGSSGNTPAAGSATTTPTDSSVTSPAQALKVSSTSTTGHASLANVDGGATVTQLDGQVVFAPVTNQAILSANPGVSVSKVEYYLNTKLISTQTIAPYVYKFNTASQRNGSYTMVVKTYYSSGSVDTRSDVLLVKNKVNAAYVTRNYAVTALMVIIILALLVVTMLRLVLPQLRRRRATAAALVHDHDALYGFGMAAPGQALVAGDPTLVAPAPVARPDGYISPASTGQAPPAEPPSLVHL